MHLGYLAQACVSAGQPEAALGLLGEAISLARANRRTVFEAELHRLNGEFLLGMRRPEEAENAFERALTVAGRQEAKMWELRAAASLARLWTDHGRHG